MSMRSRLRLILAGTGLITDRGQWLEPGRLLACAYPHRESALAALAKQGVTVLVNLHERAHAPARLSRHRMKEVHLPVQDFTAPAMEQLTQGVAEIERAIAAGQTVAVHCGGGLGRTGTLLACYLTDRGRAPADAIAEIRRLRPGSLETGAQVAAVKAYAAGLTRPPTDAPVAE
jgi:atypical dual specificity phosphatase